MAEGNRKDPRARVLNMTVRYKSATVDEFIENHSHDISRGGIFIKTRAPFPAGTLLKFEVRIAEDQRLMQGVGRVVWRREPERAEEGFPAGMGIKFIKTGEGAAELISQIVAARQGEESSFDAGARENGAVSDAPRSEGRHSVPAAPDAAEATSLEPSPKVEGAPAEGEIYVSSPPKKRVPVSSETRKVVLQGADAPPSDKTPISTRAREVSAQAAGSERAPSRPAPATRGSIVDETTAPRARSADAESPRAAQKQSSSPSVLGLVAILGAVGITLLVVKLLRGPEATPPPPTPPAVTSTTPPAVTSQPVTPQPVTPPAATPPAEPAPGAAVPTPGAGDTPPPATEPAPAAAAPSEPTAAGGAAATGTSKPSTAPTPGPTGSTAKPPAVPPAAVAPTAKPVPPVPPAPAAAKPAPAPKPPAATTPPTAPSAATEPKPKAEVKPAAPGSGEPGAAVHPAAPGQEPAAPGSAGATNDAKAHPAEPAKKRPPAATTPSEEPAPKPAEPSPAKPGPGDDNPY